MNWKLPNWLQKLLIRIGQRWERRFAPRDTSVAWDDGEEHSEDDTSHSMSEDVRQLADVRLQNS